MKWHFASTWMSCHFMFPIAVTVVLLNCLQFINLFVFSWAGENVFKSTFELLGFPFGKLCQTDFLFPSCLFLNSGCWWEEKQNLVLFTVLIVTPSMVFERVLVLLFFINYSELKLYLNLMSRYFVLECSVSWGWNWFFFSFHKIVLYLLTGLIRVYFKWLQGSVSWHM